MSRQQYDQILTALIDRRPFHPFTIELINGELVKVDDSRAIGGRDGTTVYLRPGGRAIWFRDDQIGRIVAGDCDASP